MWGWVWGWVRSMETGRVGRRPKVGAMACAHALYAPRSCSVQRIGCASSPPHRRHRVRAGRAACPGGSAAVPEGQSTDGGPGESRSTIQTVRCNHGCRSAELVGSRGGGGWGVGVEPCRPVRRTLSPSGGHGISEAAAGSTTLLQSSRLLQPTQHTLLLPSRLCLSVGAHSSFLASAEPRGTSATIRARYFS